jgi:hypothetical protein
MENQGEIDELAHDALNSVSFVKRKEALQELTKHDHPRVAEVLQQVSAHDRNREVRKLAQELLAARTGAQATSPLNISSAPSAEFPVPQSATVTIPDEPTWQCAFCGMENTGGAACAYCHAARPTGEEALFEFSEAAEHTLQPEVFLLNRGNRAFVAGHSRRLAPAGYGCILAFFIPFLLMGLAFFAVGVNGLVQWQQLNSEVVTTRGKFIDRSISTNSKGNTTYYVTFQYGLDNQTYVVEQRVDRAIYDRAEVGGVVDIVYVPDNPSLARVAGTLSNPDDAIMLVFAVFSNGILWLIALAIVKAYRKDRLLEREGQLIGGEVISAKGRYGSKGHYNLTVEYRFRAPDTGEAILDKAKETRNDLRGETLPAPGTPVAVLYRDRKTYKVL